MASLLSADEVAAYLFEDAISKKSGVCSVIRIYLIYPVVAQCADNQRQRMPAIKEKTP
jgi:hypothetical protein